MAMVALVGCGEPLAVGPVTGAGEMVEEAPDANPSQPWGSPRGETRLVLQSHGFDDERATAVAVDSQRNIIVLATFRHVADFGTGLLTAPSPEAFNLALVKYRWDGQPLWVKVFGTAPGFTGDAYAQSLAVDRNGDIVVAGRNLGPIDFGQGLVPEGGFMVRFSPDGEPLWSRHLEVDLNLFDSRMVIDHAGNIALAGSFEGVLDFGTGPISSANWSDGTATSAFLAKFDSLGRTRWVYVDPVPSDGFGLAVEEDGDLLLSGWEAVGHRQFGKPMVLKFNPPGRQMWARRPETLGFFRKVAVQGGTLTATGTFASAFQFAGRELRPCGRGMLLAAFANTDGHELWGESFDAEARGLGMDANGVFVTGAYSSGADLGLGPLAGAPGSPPYNVFVARYHRLTGRPQWTHGFVATGIAEVADLATSRSGASVIVGSFRDGTVDFGTGALVPDSRDMFLFSLTP
ncbi:hypothetical protein HV824_02325 [Myxococcus sp. AM009]|uniref:hypothetical protein n=1 Tax=Myxococcus sp. AM009 TaxID=2745137 RepID=UPI001596067B|nr:hypothetical protein [Myxococcus sp. AM009]NVI96959.1 hypothetical protein [Myxococcus sp. AM009]